MAAGHCTDKKGAVELFFMFWLFYGMLVADFHKIEMLES